MTGNATARRHSSGAFLCVAAAVLALVGSFQIALTVTIRFSPVDDATSFSVTSWGIQDDENGPVFAPLDELTTIAGLPLMAAAVVLLAATVLGMRVAPWSGTARVTRATGPVALAGAAFLAGTAWTFGMQLLSWRHAWTESLRIDQSIRGDATFGPGFWLLIAATVTAFVAVALSWRPGQPSTVREEPETPVLGIPMVSRLPDEPPPEQVESQHRGPET